MYTLQALVAKRGTLGAPPFDIFTLVELGHDIEMLPLTETVRTQVGVPFMPGGSIPAPVRDIIARASIRGEIAYIEAEFFGGTGAQVNILFQHGASVAGVAVGPREINRALQFLGVAASPGRDEFDTVGLGKHRDTEDWV
jgi:hypothetical protein